MPRGLQIQKSENCILICRWTRVAVNSARYSRFRTPLSGFCCEKLSLHVSKTWTNLPDLSIAIWGEKSKEIDTPILPGLFCSSLLLLSLPSRCVRARMRVLLISPCHVTEGGEEQGGDYLRPLLLTSSFNIISLEISNFLTTHAHTHIYI